MFSVLSNAWLRALRFEKATKGHFNKECNLPLHGTEVILITSQS